MADNNKEKIWIELADANPIALSISPGEEESYRKAEELVMRCADVPDCVRKAKEAAEEGDVILFSPASASFDAYPNFEVRGRHFKRLVEEL